MQKGDRIAVMCPNLMAFPIAMLGIARAGAVQVNVTGKALRLYVVRVAGEPQVDAECIAAHCSQALTPYKVPRQIVFVKTLPKSRVAKNLRRELRGFEGCADTVRRFG